MISTNRQEGQETAVEKHNIQLSSFSGYLLFLLFCFLFFFVSDLEPVPWNEVVLVDDASDMVDRFNKRYLEVLDVHAPVKSVKVKHRHCLFVNEEIKELMRGRDRLLKRACCTGLPVDWEVYRDSRQVVKIRLRKAEQKYINKEMEGCQNTSSQWKSIRNCLPRKAATQQVYTREVKAVAD